MAISQSSHASFPRNKTLQAKIAVRFASADRYAGEIVVAALGRSFTTAQIAAERQSADARDFAAVVCINPPEEPCGELARTLASGGKVVVFGRVGPRVAEILGLKSRGPIDLPHEWADCPLDATSHHDESLLVVEYSSRHPLAIKSPLGRRPLCRFDFADEWNNLGFGRIGLASDCWSLQTAATVSDATELARLSGPPDDHLVYAALRDTPSGAALWFNRPVGPVDSLEWSVIESFLSEHRCDDLPCFPCLGEIPAGYRGAVCARLDCDEAVASARPVVELYRQHGLPISLALLTGQPIESRDLRVLREAMAGGGSVVCHSHRHEPNWGGSYERACEEAGESRAWIEEHLPEASPVRYAVSPFHQNPPYAVKALSDCGFDGFVGGIIANDPEYLLGRAGRVPWAPRTIVSLSAQCMLHGDCYRRYGNSIDVYCQSFDEHLAAGAIFGYLDHPFSSRYRYGWPDEATRLKAHRGLIDHIQGQPDIWWAGLVDVLDFLRRRDAALIEIAADEKLSTSISDVEHAVPLAVRWKGREIVL